MNTPRRIDLTPEQLEALLKRVEAGTLQDGDYEIIKGMAETLSLLSQALDNKNTSIKRLLKLIFGDSTEKTAQVLKRNKSGGKKKKKHKGHGKNGAAAYTGAQKIKVAHESLKPKYACPDCHKGKLYELPDAGVIVRVTGNAPCSATVYELQKLRCNLCQMIFTAAAPDHIGDEKYDAASGAMIALLKYGSGLPFNRLDQLQATLGVPLPSSTQWEMVESVAWPTMTPTSSKRTKTMIDEVIEKCRQLRLKACGEHLPQVIEMAAQKNWSPLQTIAHLFDLEIELRWQNKIAACYKKSKLTEKPTIDRFDFNYHSSRKKQKNKIVDLTTLQFLANHQDIILIGNPGVGKTFLAKSIAYAATQAGKKVLFTTAMDMINHLIAAEADHSLLKKLLYYQSQDLLVIDEIGYLPLGQQGSNLFFQVISQRHEKRSSIITTNLPFASWADIFDSTSVATAIADRLVYNSQILILEGSSYRKRNNG